MTAFDQLFSTACAHDAASRLPEAQAGYRRCLAVEPAAVPVLNNLGVAARKAGALPQAGALLERALRVAPSSPIAAVNLARVAEHVLAAVGAALRPE